MQPESAQPMYQAPAPTLQQPVQTAPLKKRISNNPFRHFIIGNKNLFASNLLSALAVGVVSSLAAFALAYLYFAYGSKLLVNQLEPGESGISIVIKLVGFITLYMLLVSALVGLTYVAQLRTLIASASRRKVSVIEAFKFSASRFVKSLVTNLVVGGIVIGLYILYFAVAILSRQTILILIGGIALIVFVIIYALRMTYVNFVLADDALPGSPIQTMKRSSLLFTKSGTALFLYAIVMFIVLIIITSVMGGSAKDTPSRTYLYDDSAVFTTSSNTGVAVGSVLVSSVVTNLLSILLIAGVVSIYTDAKQTIDGLLPTQANQSAGPAPLGGVAATTQQANYIPSAPAQYSPVPAQPLYGPNPVQSAPQPTPLSQPISQQPGINNPPQPPFSAPQQ